jgi:hypothetical protein
MQEDVCSSEIIPMPNIEIKSRKIKRYYIAFRIGGWAAETLHRPPGSPHRTAEKGLV